LDRRSLVYPLGIIREAVMGTPLYKNRFRVPSTRIPRWDYRSPGAYAVTICVQGRVCCLGEIQHGHVALSPLGELAAKEWTRIPQVHPQVILDEWIIMPDHIHGILVLGDAAPGPAGSCSLGTIVGHFKKRATKRIRAQRYLDFSWQERFYEHILRNQDSLDRYRAYIRNNPLQWELGERDP
jgi:putative transposase